MVKTDEKERTKIRYVKTVYQPVSLNTTIQRQGNITNDFCVTENRDHKEIYY
jgi:hypothetical protein